MKKWIAGGFVLLVIIGAATGGGSSKKHHIKDATTAASSSSPTASVTESTPVDPSPNPDGTFNSSCDILLASDINSPSYFIGAAKMRNTGNVGIVVRVKAVWDQTSTSNVTSTKIVHMPVGSHHTTKFRVPATLDQIDELQSSPDYDTDGGCKVHVSILDSYGAVTS